MVTFSKTGLTIAAPETLTPDPNGWNVSAFLNFSAVSAVSSMDVADRSDTELVITTIVEYTTDPSGTTGWLLLVGNTWQGGLLRDGVTPRLAPLAGPYETTSWPSGIKRLRIRQQPSRTVNNVSWSLTAI